VKFIRSIAILMLALLYLGGTTAQVSRAVYHHFAMGDKAFGDFGGKENGPIHPTITVRRHLPLVKLVVVPPLVAVTQPVLERPEELRIVPSVCFSTSLHAACSASCCDRAPPHS